MIVALDNHSADVRAAEHLLHDALRRLGHPVPASAQGSDSLLVCCTHVVPDSKVAVTLSWLAPSPEDVLGRLDGLDAGLVASWPGLAEPVERGSAQGAFVALAARAVGSGRVARFPGQGALRGRLTVDELVRRSAVDAVEAIGGLDLTGSSVIDTLDFVRPELRNGRVVLAVQPAAGGVLIPFEAEVQLSCCTDH